MQDFKEQGHRDLFAEFVPEIVALVTASIAQGLDDVGALLASLPACSHLLTVQHACELVESLITIAANVPRFLRPYAAALGSEFSAASCMHPCLLLA
jgi:hypothetical protein